MNRMKNLEKENYALKNDINMLISFCSDNLNEILFESIILNDKQLFNKIIKFIKNIDCKYSSLESIYDGMTPLMVACYNGNFYFIDKLLKHGASPFALSTRGFDCLYVATFNKKKSVVEYLLTLNFSINQIKYSYKRCFNNDIKKLLKLYLPINTTKNIKQKIFNKFKKKHTEELETLC